MIESRIELSTVLYWPLRKVIVLCCIVSAVMYALVYLSWIRPLQQRLAAQTTYQQTLIHNESMQSSALESLQPMVSELNELKGSTAEVLQFFVRSDQLASVIAVISQAATLTDVRVQKVEWLTAQAFEHYIENPLRIQLYGNYQQLLEFSDHLANAPHVIDVKKVLINRASPDSEQLHIDMLLSTYQLTRESSIIGRHDG
jgi:type IV pilus assembly protein PilO